MKYNTVVKMMGDRMFTMEKILGCFWLLLLLGVVPLIIGLPWAHRLDEPLSYALAYGLGFFIRLALFQAAVTPAVFLGGRLIHVVLIDAFLLFGVCVWSLRYIGRHHLIPKRLSIERLSIFELIYLFAFVVVLSVQIVRGFTCDLTYMSLDDATYTVVSEQALEGQGLGSINTATGEIEKMVLKHILPGWLYYPAFLAFFSGLSVATVAHTVQYVQLILLAYAVFWYLSGTLFDGRQNRLIFMLLISLFYWYGYHSHYSLTFRLLGPNYQGKAVLAVSLTALVFAMLVKKLNEPFDRWFARLLFLLGTAACCLSFWGAGTFLVILAFPILISLFFKDRDFRHLLYLVSGSAVPALFVALFFVSQYAV